MKQDYFEESIEFENLYRALKKCCNNVRWKDSVVGYENNGLRNTLDLSERLECGTYKISKYQVFQIHEPKERTIVAARLVDRQFQRSLCDAGLYQDFTEHFIRDNCACQVGKGGDDAMNRLKIHMRKFFRKHGDNGWVLKCDVHHFFPETRHDVAKKAAEKYISDFRAREAVFQLVDSFGGDKGIGLGSQISQLLELAVLNDLDHFIKERLGIKHYVRYMDDFVLIHEDKDYLKFCREEIRRKLQDIGLELNKKTTLYPLSHGVRFLKWRFLLTETGKALMLRDGKYVTKYRKKMKRIHEREMAGDIPKGKTEESVRSFLANLDKGNTYKQQQKILSDYKKICGE